MEEGKKQTPSAEYKEAEKKLKTLSEMQSGPMKENWHGKAITTTFNAYLKRKTKSKASVGPLTKADGSTVTDSKEMEELLNKYFRSVFSREPNIPAGDRTDNPRNLSSVISDINITEEKIQNKIKKLRATSAPGPDGIGPGLLLELQQPLVPALNVLFRKLLDENHTPDDWKEANVTPIFKKGAKKDPSNYRPVSLTSVCCKIFESLLSDEIMDHLERNGLINNTQHGFVSGKSCATNLIKFFDAVTKAVDGGDNMDIIFLDFAKAFDKVPIQRLMSKLRAHGVKGKVEKWIENWLSNRKQSGSQREKIKLD